MVKVTPANPGEEEEGVPLHDFASKENGTDKVSGQQMSDMKGEQMSDMMGGVVNRCQT